jgi:hypothetical protein
MSTATDARKSLKGGEWLIKESLPAETFSPEEFSEEQGMIRDMCNQFLDRSATRSATSPILKSSLKSHTAMVSR